MSLNHLEMERTVWFFAGQLDESESVRRIPINVCPCKVGRRSDLTLSIHCASVSKEHAEVFEQDGELWVRDLASTNGTYVNGQRVDEDMQLREGDLVQFATVVFRVEREQAETQGRTMKEDACDRALAMLQFDRLIHENAVVPFYQPIVVMDSGEFIGFEVLGRSRLFGLSTPNEMFRAASRLNLEGQLSRIFRYQGAEKAAGLPADTNLFVNTHPVELVEDGLAESLQKIRDLNPNQRITLEIHEKAITNPAMIGELRAQLDDLDIKLAYDDFGAGQARLVELTEVRPDYIKFDMKLVQGLDEASQSRQHFVESLVSMVTDLGITPLAEGVEREQEHDICRQIGFKLGQGFLYGKPAPASIYRESDVAVQV